LSDALLAAVASGSAAILFVFAAGLSDVLVVLAITITPATSVAPPMTVVCDVDRFVAVYDVDLRLSHDNASANPRR
jgi:hypothetical protein